MTCFFDSRRTNRLYKKLRSSIPIAKTELIYSTHFELLIAVMLTAQAADKTVNEVTPSLFKKCPSPKSFILYGEKKNSSFHKKNWVGTYQSQKYCSHVSNLIKKT